MSVNTHKLHNSLWGQRGVCYRISLHKC